MIVEEAQLARLASWAKGAPVEISEPKAAPYAALEKEALEVAREVDECIENARCDGNCNHNACKSQENSELRKFTCHDCKQKFQDKRSMMDHKRDSDHPSKKHVISIQTVQETNVGMCTNKKCIMKFPNQVRNRTKGLNATLVIKSLLIKTR